MSSLFVLSLIVQDLMRLGPYKCKGPYGPDFGAKTLGKQLNSRFISLKDGDVWWCFNVCDCVALINVPVLPWCVAL
jgi:hypothetical protein